MITTTQTSNRDIQIALQAFDDGLRGIGYPSSQIQRAYGYSDFLGNGQRQTVDLAAFGSAVPSLRTCNIGVVVRSNVTATELVRLRALGAPLLFTYDTRKSQISRWRMSADGLPDVLGVENLRPDEFPRYFADHTEEWEPDAFRQARTAIYREEEQQFDFFDLGLLPALEDQLRRKLSNQIQKIASDSRRELNARNGDGTFEQHFSEYARLLFRLLAARLLSDRGDLNLSLSDTTADQMLIAVKEKYEAKESEQALKDSIVRNQVWNAIRAGLDLRNLSPETLAFVYENTLVDPELRKRNGIHATPPHIADHLLRQLPIERLPEADRVIFEPFCGNAPFLLAGMRRLRDLLPSERTPEQVHEYLVERLLGIEILPIASEIARYSLILGDYPNKNSWKVKEGDAFNDPRFEEYLKRATIVLSNPPHENFPVGERPIDAHPNRAAEALKRVLKTSPLMLGFVMPLAFVDGKKFGDLRRQLVNNYPNITITALPDNVFGKASQQTVLIAAHRLDLRKQYFWADVSKSDYEKVFTPTGKPSHIEEQSHLPIADDGTPTLWRQPIGKTAGLWEYLSSYKTLSTIAELYRGLQWTKNEGDSSSRASAVSDVAFEGSALGLGKVNDNVENYVAVRVSYLDIRPERRLYNALHRDWNKPKVLVNAVRTGRKIWRLLALPDTEGLYASASYISVWPYSTTSTSITVEVLSAILNSPLANAFIFQRVKQQHNDIVALEQIPVPLLTLTQIDEITLLVSNYKDLRWQYIDEQWTESLAMQGRRALLKIDVAVLEAYNLPADLEVALLREFDGVERRHLPFSFTGYDLDEWAAAKAELADDREGRRIADQFSNLLRKRNIVGLTTEEQTEYDRLQSLRTARRMQYRTAIESGK